MKCIKCDIPIDKLIGDSKICKICHAKRSKLYYHKMIKPVKVYKMPKYKDITYTDETGKEIKLLITNEHKKCRLCEKVKLFTDFGLSSSKEKDKKTLSADCKECISYLKVNKKLIIKSLKNITDNENNHIKEY